MLCTIFLNYREIVENMSDIVFILGAGASQHTNAPLMNEFYDRVKSYSKSELLEHEYSHFENVLNAIDKLQSVHSKAKLTLFNIEDIFSALEMARIVRRFSNYSFQQIEDTIESLKIVITSTIENSIKFEVKNNKAEPHDIYHNFVNRIQNFNIEATVSIITFNYDIALDYAFFHENIPIDYGLIDEEKVGAIPVLKLHGSLNWGYCEKCDKVEKLDFQKYFSKYEPDPFSGNSTIKIGSHIHEFSHSCKNNFSKGPVIIPPTWYKLNMHKDIHNVWSRAAKELSKASIIVVIGYSLPQTDVFFKYFYAMGTMGPNLIQKFIVIDPISEVHDSFKFLLGHGVNKFIPVQKAFAKDMPEIVKEIYKIIR